MVTIKYGTKLTVNNNNNNGNSTRWSKDEEKDGSILTIIPNGWFYVYICVDRQKFCEEIILKNVLYCPV